VSKYFVETTEGFPMNNNAGKPLAERLKAGLHEGIKCAQGKIDLRTAEVPQAPPKFSSKSVIRLRRSAGMSQAVFARLLNVSSKTVQSWEQGQRQPSQAAHRMLQIFQERPETVCQVVGIARYKKSRATQNT
jgi:putative transcriptional regulator